MALALISRLLALLAPMVVLPRAYSAVAADMVTGALKTAGAVKDDGD